MSLRRNFRNYWAHNQEADSEALYGYAASVAIFGQNECSGRGRLLRFVERTSLHHADRSSNQVAFRNRKAIAVENPPFLSPSMSGFTILDIEAIVTLAVSMHV